MSGEVPNSGTGRSSPAACATPPMMRSTMAGRLIAFDTASRTRLSRKGFLSVPFTPGVFQFGSP